MTVSELILPWDTEPVRRTRPVDDAILQSLRSLAYADADVASRAESLFLFLRKVSTQVAAREYLMGIQLLASTGDPAGSRLLAAFMDVSSTGDRLMPRVRGLGSTRRLKFAVLQGDRDPAQIHQDWLKRLEILTAQCEKLIPEEPPDPDVGEPKPGHEHPWPYLRDTMELLLARLSLEDDFDPDERALLVDLLRLEVDAWQERISNLAGSIDPYGVAAISRVLPILSIADAEIRDLRHMIGSIEEGCGGIAFSTPVSRSLDVLEDADRAALRKVLQQDPGLEPLAALFDGLEKHPVRVPVIAFCVEKLQALSDRLQLLGVPDVDLDLITGVGLVQEHAPSSGMESELIIPLAPGFPEACGGILEVAESGMGMEAAGLEGLRIQGDHLVITIPEGGSFLEHDLPSIVTETEGEFGSDEILDWIDGLASESDEAIDDEEKIDLNNATVTELKKLVLTSIQSVSVLLGFLRNPKVVAIPGLVEEVVNRTRNPKVIETICTVRLLHTGFANRSVPLACLRSPVNIPISVLRKFMHVKYVSKVDLRRLAKDKAGIRKEVNRGIVKYLATLA